MVLSFVDSETQHSLAIVIDRLWKIAALKRDEHEGKSISLIEHPVHLCALNIKKAVNSVFTHGSFHWIKARGCCVSLDSHHYACWMLMSSAHRGAVLERMWPAHVFSNAPGPSISLTISPASGSTQTARALNSTHEENIQSIIKVHANAHFSPNWW